MRRMRAVVVVMMVGSLFGCGGSDKPDPQLQERATDTRAAAGEVFPLVGGAVEASSFTSTGGGRWELCGMEPSPTGAEYVAEVAITDAVSVPAEYADRIAKAMTSAGWKVGTPTSEQVLASKDGMKFSARYGDGGINLSIRSGCVDSSKDSVRKLADEPREDLGLDLPQ